MKFSALIFMVFVFVVIPFLLLQTFVMPMLAELKQTYSAAGNIAQQVTEQ